MIGIQNIGVYIPPNRVDTYNKIDKYQIDKSFIDNVTGVRFLAKKDSNQNTSDLCVLAYANLLEKIGELEEEIDCICVCTQNGDYQLPQTSAIVHDKLNLSINCAAFDISLGCSGYVYAIHIMKNFMEANQLSNGLLFTGDPYSDILDPNDKATDLLFGDAATVTLLSTKPCYDIGKGVFNTQGKEHRSLIKEPNKKLVMQGRKIFNFSMRSIPPLVEQCLMKNGLNQDEIDKYLFHQASKYMLERVVKRLDIDDRKAPFSIIDYGNTISSSIPILLNESIDTPIDEVLLLCGFGVGLSLAATIITRIN